MIKEDLAEKRQLVDDTLRRVLQPVNPHAEIIFEAMEYSLLAGGKRLRPVLFLTTLEAFGKNVQPYLPFACALEMIHTYSLIHDDLPAMDNDDLRRGKLTCHKAFGEDYAILAGDGLLTHSFAKMFSIAEELPVEDLPKLLAATKEVALAAGMEGMLVGQVMDIACEKQCQKDASVIDLETLGRIHQHKTGALFCCSVVSAGILAGADEVCLQGLKEYAVQFGLAFQIIDDILDVVGDETTLGKPVGSDQKNQKITYVDLLGLDGAKKAAKEAVASALLALQPLENKGGCLKDIAVYLLDRQY